MNERELVMPLENLKSLIPSMRALTKGSMRRPLKGLHNAMTRDVSSSARCLWFAASLKSGSSNNRAKANDLSPLYFDPLPRIMRPRDYWHLSFVTSRVS